MKLWWKEAHLLGFFCTVVKNAKFFKAQIQGLKYAAAADVYILDEVLLSYFCACMSVIILRFVGFAEWRVYENAKIQV